MKRPPFYLPASDPELEQGYLLGIGKPGYTGPFVEEWCTEGAGARNLRSSILVYSTNILPERTRKNGTR